MAELKVSVYARSGDVASYERWALKQPQPFDGRAGLSPPFFVLLERRRDRTGKIVGERRHGQVNWQQPRVRWLS